LSIGTVGKMNALWARWARLGPDEREPQRSTKRVQRGQIPTENEPLAAGF
jgi:hypothetical protein